MCHTQSAEAIAAILRHVLEKIKALYEIKAVVVRSDNAGEHDQG
jgi:hypothetical protein